MDMSCSMDEKLVQEPGEINAFLPKPGSDEVPGGGGFSSSSSSQLG